MRFNENFSIVSNDDKFLTEPMRQVELRQLPQFFRADADIVYRLGGPIYQQFLTSLPLLPDFKYISVDSRIHMLMPDWYPCIPGWHCDDFYRPGNGQFSQPDLEHLPPIQHFAMVIGGTAFTVFAGGPWELPAPSALDTGRNLYAQYHQLIEDNLGRYNRQVKSGEIVAFDGLVFHRGTVAEANGWRLFVRLTQSNHWEPKNELRTQTQIYLPAPFNGW
jgi:hypothetical protein